MLQDIPVIKKGKDGRSHMLYGMVSAGTVAWVMYQKFCNGLPYYRQEKDWKQYGVEITRATMANWVIRNSEAFFLPMYEYFHRKLLERGFAMADLIALTVVFIYFQFCRYKNQFPADKLFPDFFQ